MEGLRVTLGKILEKESFLKHYFNLQGCKELKKSINSQNGNKNCSYHQVKRVQRLNLTSSNKVDILEPIFLSLIEFYLIFFNDDPQLAQLD